MSKGAHIIELLKKVPTESIWGTGIRLVVQTKDADRVVTLIADLRSQSRDNEWVMREILGDECYEAINSI